MTKGQRAGDGAIAVEVEEGKSYYWCSCGKSSKQPFCDGSHKKISDKKKFNQSVNMTNIFYRVFIKKNVFLGVW